MKKFISMVMAAAMVVSLVPATAFAASGTVVGTTKIVGAVEETDKFGSPAGFIAQADAAEVQIKVTDYDYEVTDGQVKQEIVLTLDDAKFATNEGAAFAEDGDYKELVEGWFTISTAKRGVNRVNTVTDGKVEAGKWAVVASDIEEDTITYTLYIDESKVDAILDEATISIDLQVVMDGNKAGDMAYVSVDTDIDGADADDLVFATVLDDGIKATL